MKNPFSRRSKAISVTPGVQSSIENGTANFSQQLGTQLGKISQNNIREAYLLYESIEKGELYATVPAVRTVVDFIARQIVQLDFNLWSTNDDGERETEDSHPAAELIEYPNVNTPGKFWMQAMISDYLVYGNSYSIKVRGPNGGFQTFWIPAWKVHPYGESIFETQGYKIEGERGSYEYLETTDVIHWQDYNPADSRRGYSKLDTLRKVLAEDITMQQTNIELMKSGLTGLGNAYISRPADAPPWSEKEGGRERFEAYWAAVNKKSSEVSPVLEDGMSLVQPNLSPQKAQMLESRKFSLETVCKVYGVPLGLLDGSVGDVEAQTNNLYQDVLPPLCDQIQGFMNLYVLKTEYPTEDLCYEFDLKSKMRGDNAARIAANVSSGGGPYLTRNEVRISEGLPPLEEKGADELITPLNVIVGDKPKPSPMVMPVQDPNGPAQDGSHRDPTTNGLPEEPSEDPVGEKSAPKVMETKALLLARRNNQDRRRNEAADNLTGVLSRHFSRQLQVMDSKAADDASAASERWNQELSTDLLSAFRSTVSHEGDVAATRLGLAGFDMAQVKHYLEKKAENIAQNVNESTAEALEAKEATRAEVFEKAKTDRAVVLGMGIATALSSFSHTEAAKQDPNVSQRMKTWVVTSGNSRHPELDGESVPLFQEFSNGEQMPGDGGDIGETAGCQCIVEVG
jgi:HK97 family phage portal protein